VPRRAPRFLAADTPMCIPEGTSGRLQLAEWLTRPDHPLTARVMVNRLWQHHFGKGIVATPSNFGLRGDTPTHPELLDFLAHHFVEHGWSIKAMHRLIMCSSTYQQASTIEADTKRFTSTPRGKRLLTSGPAIDPENKLLWHFNRRRLDAESIRDAMLYVAGKLDLSRPGLHPFPAFDDWHWTQHNPFKAVYDSDHRSVYLMRQRIQRHPYLALFDAPDANASTDVRTAATVPLQALYLMNNPFVQTQAEALATRVLSSATDDQDRIRLAHQMAWSRQPSANEIQRAREYLARYSMCATQAGNAKQDAPFEAWTSFARVLLTANEFFYID